MRLVCFCSEEYEVRAGLVCVSAGMGKPSHGKPQFVQVLCALQVW